MRICIVKATKHIIEVQHPCTAGTLIQNAVNGGYAEADVEEREVDDAEYEAAKAEDPVGSATIAAQAAQVVAQAAKAKAIIDNLPDLATVNAGINNAFPDAKQNAFMKKVLLVLYQHVADKVS